MRPSVASRERTVLTVRNQTESPSASCSMPLGGERESSTLTRLAAPRMSRHMRTTVRLDEALLRQAKSEAARRGETLTCLIEQGLRLVLASPQVPRRRRRVSLPVSSAGGGLRPGVDLDNSAALLDLLDGLE